MGLRLVVDNATPSETAASVHAREAEHFEEVIRHARAQLLDDLAYYQRKLGEVAKLDPHNRSGLLTLYQAHKQHILRLLGILGGSLRAV